MPLAWNEHHVTAVQEILDAHDEKLNLDAGSRPETQVWHLLMSLTDYCDAKGLDLDLILENVREESADCRGEVQA